MEYKEQYKAAMSTAWDGLQDDKGRIACPNCDQERMKWMVEDKILMVDCEDCHWGTQYPFDEVQRL